MIVTPNYYKKFQCIADRCKHSCCIGWEIDIDEEKLEYYESLKGEAGNKIMENISYDGDVHFCLKEGDRCPFLNEKNLCELILSLGEEALCQICADHPRFKNEIFDRLEIGLGLCCEEAGRLILGQKEDFSLEYDGESEKDDEIINLRDKAIFVMQSKEKSVEQRCDLMLSLCGFDKKLTGAEYMLKILLTLEALDDDWHTFVSETLGCCDGNDGGFAEYVRYKEEMYAKLVIYFLYRYMANASSLDEAALRAGFAVSVYKVIYVMSRHIYKKQGGFCLTDMVELCRRFSGEVEYDLDNLDIYMEECYEHFC